MNVHFVKQGRNSAGLMILSFMVRRALVGVQRSECHMTDLK